LLESLLGVVTIVVATSFFPIGRRILPWHRTLVPSANKAAGAPRSLWAAPLLGLMSGLGWTPCIGPTLAGVLSLAAVSGTAVRGSVLAACYAGGLGIPFVVLGLVGDRAFSRIRRWPRAMNVAAASASLSLVAIGLLEVTGVWSRLLVHLQTLVSATQLPL
jgi:cytochrome c-type biogenesis protein